LNVSVADITSQEYYGVQCLNDNTGEILQQGTCSDAIMTICDQMTGLLGSSYEVTNKWIWSTPGGNCTFGYWVPEGGAPAPSYDRCLKQIYGPMNDKCRGPEFNVGSINLRELPKAVNGVVTNGMAVEPGYPSYIMVAQSSMWGVNDEDAA